MISGGTAAIIYGEPRLTTDIDLVIILPEPTIPKLHAIFDSDEFYVPPIEAMRVEASRHAHGHFNIIHTASTFRADIYIAGADELIAWGLEHRKSIDIAGQTLWVAPPEYVILSKLQYFRMSGQYKHLDDIRVMLRVSGEMIDRQIITTHVDRLRLQEQWDALNVTL